MMDHAFRRLLASALILFGCLYAAAQKAPASALPKQAALDVQRIALAHYDADAAWYVDNIPFLVIDDPLLEKVYYYRWQDYRSHIREIGAQGVMVTEFLDNVPWGRQPYTDLNDSSPFHLLEGRWLRSPAVVNSLIDHLFSGYGNDRHFAEANAAAALEAVKVTGDKRPAARNLSGMMYVYNGWDDHFDRKRNLYWIQPIDDATEYTISSIDATGAGFTDTPSEDVAKNGFLQGFAYRPSINTYQYANALAIAQIAGWAERADVVSDYRQRARRIQEAVEAQLWNRELQHYVDRHQRTTPYVKEGEFIRGRELVGFTPWLYEMAPKDATRAEAWRHALSDKELGGPRGLRTVEPSYARYMKQYRYDGATKLPECQWNGPSWPFQSSQALTAMANLLDDYPQSVVTKADYLRLLRQYAQQHLAADGHADLQEDYNPDTGAPIVGLARSHHYNHSTFNDLILGGLIGIRSSLDDAFDVKPLIPESSIRNFALDRLVYHGRNIGVLYDADGSRFGQGAGLRVYVDGQLAASSPTLAPLHVTLPASAREAADQSTKNSSARMPYDLAVNIGEPLGPKASASSTIQPGSPEEAIDGRLWFFPENHNGWSPEPGKDSWFAVDFGQTQTVDAIELAFFADGKQFQAPRSYRLECEDEGGAWRDLAASTGKLPDAVANGVTRAELAPASCRAVRVQLTAPSAPATLRLIELKAFAQ